MIKKALIRLGELIGSIVNPVVIGIIFYLLLSPLALITRLFGRDELKLKDHKELSYWNKSDKKYNRIFFDKQF